MNSFFLAAGVLILLNAIAFFAIGVIFRELRVLERWEARVKAYRSF